MAAPDSVDGVDIPDDVIVTDTPREPVGDPTLGIAVDPPTGPTPKNRLVTIGDSLSHGFQSGAVYNTDLSYSAILAYELGWSGLRYPRYGGPGGGLPLNIELLLRRLERDYGRDLSLLETPLAVFDIQRHLDENEDYWERGDGSHYREGASDAAHVLAVYGYDLRDVLTTTAEGCIQGIESTASADDLIDEIPDHATERAALRVFPVAEPTLLGSTFLDLARALGEDTGDTGADEGIETLIVFLGANNVLPTAVKLAIRWSTDEGYRDAAAKGAFTIWRPTHFAAELELLAEQVRTVQARHVIWCTVPHVTVVPFARGVGRGPNGKKLAPGSRYFPFYTHLWISDDDFDENHDPHLTGGQARVIDSVIDQYNDAITDVVRRARQGTDGGPARDWRLLDLAGLLDRLAQRRYIDDPSARPPWWTPYEYPPALAALDPPLTSEYLEATADGDRARGGLFSLDGVHPTTVGYGLVAQEIMTVMLDAGVRFSTPTGVPRKNPSVDFDRLLLRDTLVTRPPGNLYGGLHTLQSIYRRFPVLARFLP